MESQGKYHRIGTMLRRLRREEKLTLVQLSQGVCSRTELERIEDGERLPHYFLMRRLLSRMGKSSNRLEYILSPKEYVLYEWRLRIQTAFVRAQYDEADKLLEQFSNAVGWDSSLHRQFYYSIKACLFRERNQRKQADECLEKAIRETVPIEDMKEAMWKCALGVEELQLFTLRQAWKDNNGERGGYSLILQYIEQYITDEEEKVKIYPTVGLGFARELYREKKYQKAAEFLEQCISLMARRGVLENMAELLNINLLVLEAIKAPEEKREPVRRQLQMLQEMFSHFGLPVKEVYYCFHIDSDLSLNYELIARTRKTHKISQEILSQDACSQEALSRIENGRINLTNGTFLKLSQALQANYDVSGLSILTDDFSVLEWCGKISFLYMEGKYDQAEKILDDVEHSNMEDAPENRQYLLTQRTWIRLMRKELTLEQALDAYREALVLTLPQGEDSIGDCVLTHRELVLATQMAIVYSRLKQPKRAVEILESILKNYDQSRMLPLSHIQRNSLIIGNLSMFLETTEQWQEAFDLALRNIELNLPLGHTAWVIRGLGTLGSAGEAIGKPEVDQYFRWAFYLSQLMGEQHMSQIIRNYVGDRSNNW